jgi:hypothetical protein
MSQTAINVLTSGLATAATGIQGQTILNTDTLLPAGLWIGGLIVVWRASWRVSEAVQKFLARMDHNEESIDLLVHRVEAMERKCRTIHNRISDTQRVTIEGMNP